MICRGFHPVRRLDRFLRDARGSVLTEFVIVFPILVWAWVGMFYYWDVYRAVNLAQKASFTVSDNLSRSSGEVTTDYITGVGDLLAYLAEAEQGARMRVTSLKWNTTSNLHEVSWSYSPGSAFPVLTDATLDPIRSRLPTLVEFDTVLLIETEIDYEPPLPSDKVGALALGVGPRTLTEFIVTRPRFVNKVCLAGTTCA